MNLNTMASDCTNNELDKKAVEFRVADISCTSCHSEINIYKQRSVFQHPILRVLMCKKCFRWYSSGEIERGEDGADLQCRWCGDGGDVFCCNNCSNVFCKDCITINLGEEELKRVESTDKWFCYVCDNEPLCCLRDKYNELKTTLDNDFKVTILSEDEDEDDVNKAHRMSEKELSHWDVNNLQLSLTEQETAKHNLQTFEESISSLVPISRTLSNSLSYALSQVKKIDLAHENVTMGKLDDIYNKINSNLHNLLSAFSSVKSSKGSKTRNRKKGNKKGGMLKNGREAHIENGCSNSKSKEPSSQGSQSETPRIKLTISKKSLGLTSDGANNVSTFGSTREEIINGDEDDNVVNDDDEDDNIVPAVAEDIDKDDDDEEEEDDDDVNEKESNDEGSDDKEASGDSSGDEYNPKKDIRDIKEQMKVKKEKGKQPKAKSAKRSLQKIKEKLRLKKLKVQLEKSKKGSKDGEDGEEEEEDDDGDEGSNEDGKEGSAKKKSDGKKKKKKKKEGEDEDGDSDEHCSKRRKNILDKKLQKFQKSKAEDEGDSNDDDKDDNKDDKFDDDIKKSIRSISRLLKQKIVRGKEKHASRRSAKSTSAADANDDKDDDNDDDKDGGENSNIGQLPDDNSELRNEYSAISDDQPNVEDSMLGEDKSRSPGVEKKKKSRITDDLFMDDSNGNMDGDDGEGCVDDEKEVHTSLRDYDLCNDQFDLEDQVNEEQVGAADDDDDGGDFDNSDDMIDKVVEHCTSKKKKNFEKFRKLMNSDEEDGNMYNKDGDDVENDESNENDENAGDEDSKSDDGLKSSKKKKRDRLLAASLLSSDDEPISSKKGKKKDAEDAEEEDDLPKKKRSRKKKVKSDDDDDDDGDGLKAIMDESDEDTKKKKRRRVRMESSSEDDDKDGSSSDDMQSPSSGKKRKKIHKIFNSKKLSKETIDAAKAEEERKKRIEERQKLFNQVTVEDSESPMNCPITTKLVLEMDPESNEPLIEVHKKVICKLKPHQVEAVKFMWSCCIESLEMLKKEKEEGSGCILAHCMGLGKTLSVISFVHTVLRFRKHTSLKTCLVLTPLNTILNWDSEFERWLKGAQPLDVYEMSTVKDNWSRSEVIKNWREGGGVLIMGYDMFRTLSQLTRVKNKKQKVIITEGLLSPGPDIVVCDEGHILKNDATGLSKACNKIKTRRRIVLTGTPLQNNLSEYHCMVNFVKPNLLGTRKEFLNRFVNPITNGQCSDSTPRDVKIMKNRAHVLHETLNGCVQRRDYSSLTKYLLPKLEYVILIRLSKVQVDLYQAYLQRSTSGDNMYGPIRGSRIFTDYQNLMKIWTHPWVLKLDEIRQECRRLYKDDADSFIDDSNEESFFDSEESALDAGSGSEDDWKPRRKTRNSVDSKAPEQPPPKKKKKKSKFSGSMDEEENEEKEDDKEVVKGWKSKSRRGGDEPIEEAPLELEDVDKEDRISSEWWADYLKPEDEYDTHISGKLMLLAEILKLSESIGDKVLLFSQSLLSLDLIEKFLMQWDEDPKKKLGGTQGWCKGYDYIRMDGSTSAQNRKEWTEMFNDETNPKVRLFLISTKAGSLGINLVAANRVIIFDASWNPTHDVQSIFRVYRFGQTKPVYVYRFLAQGTMEEKIYERQVLKQSLAQRVIDEHQIERHFTSADLRELYTFKPDVLDPQNTKPTPKLPNDRLLAELLTDHDKWVVQYHEHDSLLENRPEEELTEEERKAAWEEYELEKKGLLNRHNFNFAPNMMGQQGDMFSNTYYSDVQKFIHTLFLQNPGITQDQLNEKAKLYMHLQMTQQQNYMQHQQRERERLLRLQQANLLQRQRIANLQSMGPITIDEEPSSSSQPPTHQSTPPVSRS